MLILNYIIELHHPSLMKHWTSDYIPFTNSMCIWLGRVIFFFTDAIGLYFDAYSKYFTIPYHHHCDFSRESLLSKVTQEPWADVLQNRNVCMK